MAGANDFAADRTLLNAINLVHFEGDLQRQVSGMLTDLEAELRSFIRDADLGKVKATAFRLERARGLLTQVEASLATGYGKIGTAVGSELRDLASLQNRAARDVVNTAFGVDIGASLMTPQDLRSLADDALVQGLPAKEWWGKQRIDAAAGLRREIRLGAMQGQTNDEIVRRTMGSPAGKAVVTVGGKRKVITRYAGGVFQGRRRDAMSIVRTSVQSVSNDALLETYRQNADVIRGVQVLVTLDDRTTEICIALSGGAWDLEGNPLKESPVQKKFPGPPPYHWQCRSITTPITKDWKTLGEDVGSKKLAKLKDVPPTTRASMDGQVSAGHTYQSWLRTKPEAFQRRVLGPGKYELWKDGKITSQQLINPDTLQPRSLKELRLLDGPEGAVQAPLPGLPDYKYLPTRPKDPSVIREPLVNVLDDFVAGHHNPDNPWKRLFTALDRGDSIDDFAVHTRNQWKSLTTAEQKLVQERIGGTPVAKVTPPAPKPPAVPPPEPVPTPPVPAKDYATLQRAWEKSIVGDDRAALGWWMDTGYGDVLDELAGQGSTASRARVKKYLPHLKSVVDRAPRYTGEMYRGILVDEKTAASMTRRGGIFEHRELASWSKNEQVAIGFSKVRTSEGKTSIVFKLKNGSAVDLSRISQSLAGRSEQEVFASNAQRFKIVSVRDVRIGNFKGAPSYKEVTLEYMGDVTKASKPGLTTISPKPVEPPPATLKPGQFPKKPPKPKDPTTVRPEFQARLDEYLSKGRDPENPWGLLMDRIRAGDDVKKLSVHASRQWGNLGAAERERLLQRIRPQSPLAVEKPVLPKKVVPKPDLKPPAPAGVPPKAEWPKPPEGGRMPSASTVRNEVRFYTETVRLSDTRNPYFNIYDRLKTIPESVIRGSDPFAQALKTRSPIGTKISYGDANLWTSMTDAEQKLFLIEMRKEAAAELKVVIDRAKEEMRAAGIFNESARPKDFWNALRAHNGIDVDAPVSGPAKAIVDNLREQAERYFETANIAFKAARRKDFMADIEILERLLGSLGDDFWKQVGKSGQGRLAKIQWTLEQHARSWANNGANRILINTDARARVLIHEFSHHLEYKNPIVQERMNLFRSVRAKDDRLRAIDGRTEYGWEDEFNNHYMGRFYGDESTELYSMGMEMMARYDDFFDFKFGDFVKKDPDHLALLWSTLRGY